ncbi:MAG: CpsD/CapB family tyrosine-protein kinase [Prolixibacteraceae bacterium]
MHWNDNIRKRQALKGILLENRLVRSVKDIEKNSRIDVFGTVPHTTWQPDRVDAPFCPALEEAFRRISTNLLFFFSKPEQKVIGIHSVRPGEGKTFVSVSFAWYLALCGKKVLLAGTNLSSPALSRLTGAPPGPGLSSCLEGQPFESCIREIGPGGLWLMPEGPAVDDPGGLLGGDPFRMMISRSKEVFDCVILDNTSAVAAPDRRFAPPACVLNQVVVRAGRSRTNEVRFVHHLRRHDAVRNLAFILNDLV